MMRLWLAVAAFAALTASAGAADMPLKAPILAVPSWSGFYVGGNVGYSWGNADNDWSYFAAASNGHADATTCRPAGGALCATASNSDGLNGVIGGVQAGYNWQIGAYLAGIESDFQASGQRGSDSFNAAFSLTTPPPGTISTSYTERLDWFGTVRARAGYIVGNQFLIYATGGLAYGRVTIDGSGTSIGSAAAAAASGLAAAPCANIVFGGFGTCPFANFGDGINRLGWTVGAGIEGAIVGNWTWKLEYLHIDLGSGVAGFATLPGCYGTVTAGGGACIPVLAGTGSASSRVTDEIVRVGINYRFGLL